MGNRTYLLIGLAVAVAALLGVVLWLVLKEDGGSNANVAASKRSPDEGDDDDALRDDDGRHFVDGNDDDDPKMVEANGVVTSSLYEQQRSEGDDYNDEDDAPVVGYEATREDEEEEDDLSQQPRVLVRTATSESSSSSVPPRSVQGVVFGVDEPPVVPPPTRVRYVPSAQGVRPRDVDHTVYGLQAVARDEESGERVYVFGKRDATCFYADVTRFRVPYHSIFLVEPEGEGGERDPKRSAMVFGERELPTVDKEPPYEFDSRNPTNIIPNVMLDARHVPVRGTRLDMVMTARRFEYEFLVRGEAYSIAILISPPAATTGSDGDDGRGGRYSDVVALEDGEELFYDTVTEEFCRERPEHAAALVTEREYPNMSRLVERSKTHALPIPVPLFNSVDWNLIRSVHGHVTAIVDLCPETVIAFRRRPPPVGEDIDRRGMLKWILKNVVFTALTQSLSAVVRVSI